jgi:hypothetical protein
MKTAVNAIRKTAIPITTAKIYILTVTMPFGVVVSAAVARVIAVFISRLVGYRKVILG